jgi:hypothetical protein
VRSLSRVRRGSFFPRRKTGRQRQASRRRERRADRYTFDISRPKNDADKLHFTLSVRNNTSKMLELRFPDGQTHDFVVKDFAGKEIWRWSHGRMFTSALRTETLKGKGETAFEESWDSKGRHGSFTAVAVLRSNNFPVETSVQFMLP